MSRGPSRRVESIPPYVIQDAMARVRARRERGEPTLDLHLGQARAAPPMRLMETAARLAQDGPHGYTSSLGLQALRAVVVARAGRMTGATFDAETQCIATPGAKHAFAAAAFALLNPGDRALIPELGYPPTANALRLAGVDVETYPLDPSRGFAPDLDALSERARGARMVVLNSPHNPTGYVADDEVVDAFASIARREDAWLVSDEVYDHFVFDDVHRSPAGLAPEHTLVIGSFSKTFAIPGWRLGYALGPEDAIAALRVYQDATTTCPTSFVQYAAALVLGDEQVYLDGLLKRLRASRDAMVEHFGAHLAAPPRGALFGMLRAPGGDGDALAAALLERGVATVPGSAFGAPGAPFVRASFVPGPRAIAKAAGLAAQLFGP